MRKTTLTVIGAAIALGLFAAGALSPAIPRASDEAPTSVLGDARVTGGDAIDVPRLAASVESLQERVRSNPQDGRSWALLGVAYLQTGRASADPTYYPKAEGALKRSLEIDRSRNLEASLGMGLLALGRHDFEGALRWGRRALAISPASADALGVMGDATLELGHYPAAARLFQRMVDRRPDATSYARVSYFRELTGDVRGAISAMKTAVGFAGTPSDAAWSEYQLGELYLGRGEINAAARHYRAAIQHLYDLQAARGGLAKVKAARGHIEEAIADLEEVVAVTPLPEYVLLLGDLERRVGDRKAAERNYGLVRAMAQLTRANGGNPDMEMALFAADHGEGLGEALQRIRAEYRHRKSIHVADALAWTLHAAGRDRAAWRYAREALRLGTRSALFHYHAGMIAGALGYDDIARRHLNAALSINPHFSVLHAETARRTLARS